MLALKVPPLGNPLDLDELRQFLTQPGAWCSGTQLLTYESLGPQQGEMLDQKCPFPTQHKARLYEKRATVTNPPC